MKINKCKKLKDIVDDYSLEALEFFGGSFFGASAATLWYNVAKLYPLIGSESGGQYCNEMTGSILLGTIGGVSGVLLLGDLSRRIYKRMCRK